MSRERPAEPPRAVPDAERGYKSYIERRKERQEHELVSLKRVGLVGLFAGFSAMMTRGAAPTPKFIRRGYESNILDELRDFFTFRSWRPRRCRSIRTRKEHRKILRRMMQAKLIVRLGRWRYGLTKVSPYLDGVVRMEAGTPVFVSDTDRANNA